MTMSNNVINGQFGDTTLTKVFVGGLAWETPKEALREHFDKYGEILEAVIISDKLTGRSKGYGFVSLSLLFLQLLYFAAGSDVLSPGFYLVFVNVHCRSHSRRLRLLRRLARTRRPSSTAAAPTAIWLPSGLAAPGRLQPPPLLLLNEVHIYDI